MDPKHVLVVVSLVLAGIAVLLASIVGWVTYKEWARIKKAEQLRQLRKRYKVETSEEELRRLVARRANQQSDTADILIEAGRY